MSYREKLQSIKNSIFRLSQVQNQLLNISSNTNLATFDDSLDFLLQEGGSLIQRPIDYIKDVVRLLIILDISGSMIGTEEDIYFGLKELIAHHKSENILFNFVVFNRERTVLFDDVHIGNVKIPEIMVGGGTNLNGTLYQTINEKCKEGVNLVVTLSDGADNTNVVSASSVKALMQKLNTSDNNFYFLGEPNEEQTPEEVYASARQLGFSEENISVFTRKGNGNRLNFKVISKMLDELLEYGSISKTWSEPIKEHYLALTDKRG